MQVGDLVSIEVDRGTGRFQRTDMLGLGIVLDIQETARVGFGSVMDVYLGADIKVAMTSGEVRVFNERSVRVINKSP